MLVHHPISYLGVGRVVPLLLDGELGYIVLVIPNTVNVDGVGSVIVGVL